MHNIRTITKIVGNVHETAIIVVQLQNVAVCVKAFNYIWYALHAQWITRLKLCPSLEANNSAGKLNMKKLKMNHAK